VYIEVLPYANVRGRKIEERAKEAALNQPRKMADVVLSCVEKRSKVWGGVGKSPEGYPCVFNSAKSSCGTENVLHKIAWVFFSAQEKTAYGDGRGKSGESVKQFQNFWWEGENREIAETPPGAHVLTKVPGRNFL